MFVIICHITDVIRGLETLSANAGTNFQSGRFGLDFFGAGRGTLPSRPLPFFSLPFGMRTQSCGLSPVDS